MDHVLKLKSGACQFDVGIHGIYSHISDTMSPTIIDLTAPDLGESKNDSQDGSDQMLQDVLRAAHRDRLYRTLYLLCHDNDIARRVKGILLIEEDKVQSKVFKEMRALSEGEDDEKSDSEADDDQDESEALPSANDVKVTKQGHTANTKNDGKDDVSGQISAGVKRLRSRYATCSNCLEEFDVTQNGKIDCVWHPG